MTWLILFLIHTAYAGFTAGGVAAGSWAALWQAAIGNVQAGSLFSILQSIGLFVRLRYFNLLGNITYIFYHVHTIIHIQDMCIQHCNNLDHLFIICNRLGLSKINLFLVLSVKQNNNSYIIIKIMVV